MGATLEDDVLYLFCYDRRIFYEEGEYSWFIKCADLITGAINVILLGGKYSDSDYHDGYKYWFDDYWITEKYLYGYKQGDGIWRRVDRSTGVIDVTFNLHEHDLYVENRILIDGKIYYMENENRASEYSRAFVQIDLEKEKRRILFKYTPQLKGDYVMVTLDEINEDGIYIWENNYKEEALYKMPLHDGKIEKVESYASDWHSVSKII